MNSKAKQSIERITSFKYELILEGICVGAIAGVLVSFFRMALIKAESLRGSVIDSAFNSPGHCILAMGSLMILLAGTWLCLKAEPMCGGSGIPQVKGELRGRMHQNWWRIILTKLAGGIMAIGAGLSLGREGPSIQIGAMAGKAFSRLGNRLATEEKMLMTCGAGAGLSCAFSAPLAGVVFTLEGLHKTFTTEILLSTMAASITADFVAYNIFGLKPVFDLSMNETLPVHLYWLILILGVILGIFGVAYNSFTALVQDLYDKIPFRGLRLAVPFVLVIPLAAFYPYALGSGYALVNEVAAGRFVITGLIVLLTVKFLYSVISFGSGAPGGIFLPLLVIGGVTGGLFATAAGSVLGLEDYYIANFVIYGMVGYFAAIVRSPITGVILITEMTGDFTNFLSLCIVALAAYVTADMLNGKPVYDQLLERMLAKDADYGMTGARKKHKVLMQSDVCIGSLMDGEKIEKMLLPKGCLVVSVLRGSEELVPNGSTLLQGGDKITILCDEGDMEAVETKLSNICKSSVN